MPNDNIIVSSKKRYSILRNLKSKNILINQPGGSPFYEGITVGSLIISARGLTQLSNILYTI